MNIFQVYDDPLQMLNEKIIVYNYIAFIASEENRIWKENLINKNF